MITPSNILYHSELDPEVCLDLYERNACVLKFTNHFNFLSRRWRNTYHSQANCDQHKTNYRCKPLDKSRGKIRLWVLVKSIFNQRLKRLFPSCMKHQQWHCEILQKRCQSSTVATSTTFTTHPTTPQILFPTPSIFSWFSPTTFRDQRHMKEYEKVKWLLTSLSCFQVCLKEVWL